MAKKKSKFSLEKLVCAVLAIAGMVATIIGVFGDFLKSKVEISAFGGTSESKTLYALKDMVDGELEMFDVMNVFAYVVFGAAIASAVFMLIAVVVKNSSVRKFTTLVGALTVIATVVLFVLILMFCSKNSTEATIFGLTGKYTFSMAIGAILTLIGGVVSGISAVAGTLKK
ncbi:MAG: hypothetical protein PUK12_02450 [Clostridiales bacterium]|nr:hypothetical protein [Clostridiales bacterium]MDY5726660.1 hypothetical protein [Eubacteriales bacterium]